ncbi:VOC family protein [Natronosporangium hydrolyticum]|uniref:VOC family protein n=1 Tax=Natronosporangium hydrolyticum TaxID=2811111 RepID=A0A895Y7K7_9ACTN|nr:VOC family protein [Natronosporangium hydrolyticum]QSB13341.1 VOC family protein [Natronosporangium hydrolyticum]
MTASLSHLFMRVADLPAARTFWVDQLGLLVLHEEAAGYLRVGGRDGFHLGIEQGDPGPPNALEIAVQVADVDDTYQALIAAGVPADTAPADQPWGRRHAWVRDPDNRRISIFS